MRISAILPLVALLALAPGVRAQTPGTGLLICTVPPTDAQCQVQFAAKDTAVVVVVKPGQPLPSGVTELTVASDRCCTTASRVPLDADGQVRIRWSSASTPDAPVHLHVLLPRAHAEPAQGVVTLLPPNTPPALPINVTDKSGTNEYVWVRDGYVPGTVILDVASTGDHLVHESDCGNIRFDISPDVEGKVTPDSGYTHWEQGHRSSAGTCRLETRWKLGQALRQNLDVRLSGTNLQTRHTPIHGIGRLDPRVMGGLGKFQNIVRDVQCNSATERPQCAALDSFPQTLSFRTSGVEPYGAVEFPLIFMTRFRGRLPELVFERVRLAGGTTLRHPERNPFAAINVMPLVIPSLEGVPFQLTIGSTLGAKKSFFYGVSVDASIIVKPLVGIFGITSG